MQQNIRFASYSGEGDIAGIIWDTPGPARAVVQISHGMAEHIARYAHLADFLNARGYAALGHDHAGHGASIHSVPGHFSRSNGVDTLVGDISALRDIAEKRYPNVPLVLLGHSMGSFIARIHAERHPGLFDGYIFMGSSGRNLTAERMEFFVKFRARFRGAKPDKLLSRIAFAGYNKRIPRPRTKFDWLSSRDDAVDAYIADTKCGFPLTSAAFLDLAHATNEANYILTDMDKEKPVLVLSGSEDPVGHYGDGHYSILRQLETYGVQKITDHLYEGGRHELLNDTMADTVMQDISAWLEGVVG